MTEQACCCCGDLNIGSLEHYFLSRQYSRPTRHYSHIMAILGVVGIILVTMVYICIRINLAVRRHKNQIHVLQVQQIAQTDEIANFSSFVKFTVGTFYLYFVSLVCHLTYLISFFATKNFRSECQFENVFLFSRALLYLNSSLNPIIYC